MIGRCSSPNLLHWSTLLISCPRNASHRGSPLKATPLETQEGPHTRHTLPSRRVPDSSQAEAWEGQGLESAPRGGGSQGSNGALHGSDGEAGLCPGGCPVPGVPPPHTSQSREAQRCHQGGGGDAPLAGRAAAVELPALLGLPAAGRLEQLAAVLLPDPGRRLGCVLEGAQLYHPGAVQPALGRAVAAGRGGGAGGGAGCTVGPSVGQLGAGVLSGFDAAESVVERREGRRTVSK